MRQPEVGFVGVGRMGAPMCGHMLAAGYRVTVFDPAEAAKRDVVERGARAAATAAAAASGADLTFVMAGYVADVQRAVTGPDGVLAGARPGSTVVVASTVSPEEARDLGAACADASVGFLDAPVCHGERGAVGRFLTWLVGGSSEDFARAEPVMRTCGDDVIHLGSIGAGMTAKAVNNLLMWTAVAVNNEGLELARRHGVATEVLIPALLRASAGNFPLTIWSDVGPMPWARKDLDIVHAMAADVDLAVPLAELLRSRTGELVRKGAPDGAGV